MKGRKYKFASTYVRVLESLRGWQQLPNAGRAVSATELQRSAGSQKPPALQKAISLLALPHALQEFMSRCTSISLCDTGDAFIYINRICRLCPRRVRNPSPSNRCLNCNKQTRSCKCHQWAVCVEAQYNYTKLSTPASVRPVCRSC